MPFTITFFLPFSFLTECVTNFYVKLQEYLATLKKEDGTFPNVFNEDDVRPALVAYFRLARLFDKYLYLPDDLDLRIKNKIQTYSFYLHVVDYCRKNPSAKEVMAAELPLCEELVALLPKKIQKMYEEKT